MQTIDINIYDEDGKMKSKKDFNKEMEQLYDKLKEINTKEGQNYCSFLFDEDNHINIENVLNTHHFLKRVFYIKDEIDHNLAQKVHKFISFYNNIDYMNNFAPEERMPIRIYIDSYGGQLYAAFSIISSIKASKTPVYTYNIGRAFSAGFFILISGHKRFGGENTYYLFHEGSTGEEGDAHKVIASVEFYKKLLSDLKELTLNHTKITKEFYEAHHKDDVWLTVKEALDFGVIDSIINNEDMEVMINYE